MFEAQGTLEKDFSKVPRWGSEEDLYGGIDERPSRAGHPRANGSAAMKNAGAAAATNGGSKAKTKQAVLKKGGKKQTEPESEQDDEDDDDDDDDDENMSEEESEEERVALKSRRARAIPVRKA